MWNAGDRLRRRRNPAVLDHGRLVSCRAERRHRTSRAIEQLLADKERRAELGRRSRTVCEERYDARRQTAELVRLTRLAVEQRA